ncbi:sine oculis-binding protein homolog B-like [Watersipora subatra]|uniref:sine oculis-binding protein homolog B-like n=1 Tax=Watersipora subatra TaxID=2589382 RepID=UPI00355C45AF
MAELKDLQLPACHKESSDIPYLQSELAMVQWRNELTTEISFAADDDDEEMLSNMSDSEEEDPNTLFTYKPPPPNEADNCDWCAATSTHRELALVTHDRQTKSFCSEDCQRLYKNSILSHKICEWCRQHFPSEPSLIVVEPSLESVPLQFCSQSCINKYKMELFCEEVKEQLRRIKDEKVQLPAIGSTKSIRTEKKILITPELWNKGDSTVVYIDDYPAADTESSHNTFNYDSPKLNSQQSGERKRKGNKMETVISKLSRRQFPKMECDVEQEPMTRECQQLTESNLSRKNTGNENLPINLSVYRTTGPNFRANNSEMPPMHKQMNDHPSSVRGSQKDLSAMPAPPHQPLIIPLPMFIPVPVPIPIPTCMTALSQSFGHQSNSNKNQSLPSTPTIQREKANTSPPIKKHQEKQNVLKKQPLSDAPE